MSKFSLFFSQVNYTQWPELFESSDDAQTGEWNATDQVGPYQHIAAYLTNVFQEWQIVVGPWRRVQVYQL